MSTWRRLELRRGSAVGESRNAQAHAGTIPASDPRAAREAQTARPQANTLGRGWPRFSAIIIAALLHAIVLGRLMPGRHDPPAVQQPESLRVTLVGEPRPEAAQPSPPPAPSAPEPEPAEHPAEAPAADAVASPADLSLAAAPPRPAPKPAEVARGRPRRPHVVAHAAPAKPKPAEKPAPTEAPSASASAAPDADQAPRQTLGERAAVYDVLVGAGGSVEAVRLARSSGIAGYDEAGERMIRGGISFAPPDSASPDGRVMVVTIRFSPEER